MTTQDDKISQCTDFKDLEVSARDHVNKMYLGSFWQRNKDYLYYILLTLLFLTVLSSYYQYMSDEVVEVCFLIGMFAVPFSLAVLLLSVLVLYLIKLFKQRPYLTVYYKAGHALLGVSLYVFALAFFSYFYIEIALTGLIEASDDIFNSYPFNLDENLELSNVLAINLPISAIFSLSVMAIYMMAKSTLDFYGVIPKGLKPIELHNRLYITTARGSVEYYIRDTVVDVDKNSLKLMDKLISKCHLVIQVLQKLVKSAESLADQEGDLTHDEYSADLAEKQDLLITFKALMDEALEMRQAIIDSSDCALKEIKTTRSIGFDNGIITIFRRLLGVEQLSETSQKEIAEQLKEILEGATFLNQELDELVQQAEELLPNEAMERANATVLHEYQLIVQNALSLKPGDDN